MDGRCLAFASVAATLALAAFALWRPALVVATGHVADARFVEVHWTRYTKHYDLLNLAITHGTHQNAYFDVFVDVKAMTIRVANDTTFWAAFLAVESLCNTSTPVLELDKCPANQDKTVRDCVAAVYIGEKGIHRSTQYYECKDILKGIS
ncbi:uncharacterized protein LOC144134544 [Amblyomma americanum]